MDVLDVASGGAAVGGQRKARLVSGLGQLQPVTAAQTGRLALRPTLGRRRQPCRLLPADACRAADNCTSTRVSAAARCLFVSSSAVSKICLASLALDGVQSRHKTSLRTLLVRSASSSTSYCSCAFHVVSLLAGQRIPTRLGSVEFRANSPPLVVRCG